jgi:hypothetical protein
MNAGHSEGTLYKHYLKGVTKDEAEAFRKIFPEETLKAAAESKPHLFRIFCLARKTSN